jgi:hypothetical protein
MNDRVESQLTWVSQRLSSTGYFLGLEIDSKSVKATDLYMVAAELEDFVASLLMAASQLEESKVN